MARYVLRRSLGALLILLIIVTVIWLMVKGINTAPRR
jgi:hypothetical protein